MKNESNVRFTTVVLVLAGFGAVFLAWNGAAGEDHVPAQLPYLISGGLTGVMLAGTGLVLLRNFESRRDSRRLESRLEAVREALDRLAAEQQAHRTAPPVAGAVSRAASPTEALGGQASALDHLPVVAGPSTYHREDCHLVANRQVPRTSRAAARQRNLSACRVCNPDDGSREDAEGPAAARSEWEPAR